MKKEKKNFANEISEDFGGLINPKHPTQKSAPGKTIAYALLSGMFTFAIGIYAIYRGSVATGIVMIIFGIICVILSAKLRVESGESMDVGGIVNDVKESISEIKAEDPNKKAKASAEEEIEEDEDE